MFDWQKEICYGVYSHRILNSYSRQYKYACPAILSGISWEPRVDLRASLIACGFIESTINSLGLDDAITLASRKHSGLKEMPVDFYHIPWTKLSGTRCVDFHVATDMSCRWYPIYSYVGSQAVCPVGCGTHWALRGQWDQSRPHHGVYDWLWCRARPEKPPNKQAGSFVIIKCRQRKGGPPYTSSETDKPNCSKGEVVSKKNKQSS